MQDSRTGDDSDRSVKILWHFSQSPMRVWQAWTDAEMIKQWFGSDPQGLVLWAHVDLRVGGCFEVTFINSDNSKYTCTGSYKEIDIYRKLTFTWMWRDRPGPLELVTVRLEEEREGAAMEFEHTNIDPNTTHNYLDGWKSTFSKLERLFR